METKRTGIFATITVVVALTGFSSTACRDLDIPTSLQPPDSTVSVCDPCNVVPAGQADLELKLQSP
jgi:hypothetical protein